MYTAKLDRIRLASTAALAVLAGAAGGSPGAKRISEEELPPCALATVERESGGAAFLIERAIRGESIVYIAGITDAGRVHSITVAQDGTLIARIDSH